MSFCPLTLGGYNRGKRGNGAKKKLLKVRQELGILNIRCAEIRKGLEEPYIFIGKLIVNIVDF